MFAFYQHWLVTRDVAWLKSTAYPIIDVRVCVCVCVCVSVCKGVHSCNALCTAAFFNATRFTTVTLAPLPFPTLQFKGIATFWASKAVANKDGTYSIPDIMGPDEYHGPVTDSVYCNVVAQVGACERVSVCACVRVCV